MKSTKKSSKKVSKEIQKDDQRTTREAVLDRCTFVVGGKRCKKKVQQGKDKCDAHSVFNKECPVCLDEDDDISPWFLLSCAHRVHEECLKGMNKEECPLCRVMILNLPRRIKSSIRKNREKYQEELYQEERQAILEQEQVAFVPPQLAFVLAYKYLCELGISPYLLPRSINLKLDPASPPPPSEYIFQETVGYVISHIRERLAEDTEIPEEDDICYIDGGDHPHTCENCGCDLSSDEDENPFHFEGPDLRTITTTPILPGGPRDPEASRVRAYMPRSVFNTMTIDLSNLPPMSQGEVISLSSTIYIEDDEDDEEYED